MKVDDRSVIAEHWIYQLWERNYFSTIPLKTIEGHEVVIISTGIRNEDTGPDFKSVSIKIDDQIYNGDLEIHRAPEDWYLHSHHADPAYNQVVMHLVIGPEKYKEPAIRLNRQPVPIQVFVDIPEYQLSFLTKRYQLLSPNQVPASICELSTRSTTEKLFIIDSFGRQRFQDKVDRFIDLRQTSSWNQILYMGIMEALGYSKNQIPFRKLAQLFPFEALMREFHSIATEEALLYPLGLLLGLAGLLPSQDSSFDWRKVKDEDTHQYVAQLEKFWRQFSQRLGLTAMRKEEWQFFRMRPTNFPTRRLAGAALILHRFVYEGILEKILRIIQGLKTNYNQLIHEIEDCFVCNTGGYWATHYRLEEKPSELLHKKSTTLVGRDRARNIIVNVILPGCSAYASETEDEMLKIEILQIHQAYPKESSNSIIKEMTVRLFGKAHHSHQLIDTAAKQQGLIHLYKLYCHRVECKRCSEERDQILNK